MRHVGIMNKGIKAHEEVPRDATVNILVTSSRHKAKSRGLPLLVDDRAQLLDQFLPGLSSFSLFFSLASKDVYPSQSPLFHYHMTDI